MVMKLFTRKTTIKEIDEMNTYYWYVQRYMNTINLMTVIFHRYVPYVADSKRAMDEYTSEIFMGGKVR